MWGAHLFCTVACVLSFGSALLEDRSGQEDLEADKTGPLLCGAPAAQWPMAGLGLDTFDHFHGLSNQAEVSVG